MATHEFHRGDPVTCEVGGMCYKGVFQRCKGSRYAEVIVTEQGGRETNCSTLVEVSSLRPLVDKARVE